MIVAVARPEPDQFIAQLRRDLSSPPLFFSRRAHPGNKSAAEAEWAPPNGITRRML